MDPADLCGRASRARRPARAAGPARGPPPHLLAAAGPGTVALSQVHRREERLRAASPWCWEGQEKSLLPVEQSMGSQRVGHAFELWC